MTTTPRRSAKAPPTKIQPTQDTYEMHQSTLERRFGKVLLIEGFLGAPNLVRELALDKEHIGMTRTELLMWECIISKQRNNRPPWPSIETIAGMMQCSIRTVQRYIRRLEKKGLLIVTYGVLNERNNYTNSYDFTPLYKRVIALYDLRQVELAAKIEALRQQGLSVLSTQGDSFVANGITVSADLSLSVSNTQGDSFVANGAINHPSTFIFPTKLEPDRDPKTPPNEDHDQEKDELRYDSRSRTDKEAFDYTTPDVPNGYTNRTSNDEQPSNLRNTSYNDQDAEPNADHRNRENRNRTTESAGGGGNSVDSGIVDEKQWKEVAQRVRERTEHERVLTAYITNFTDDLHDNDGTAPSNVSRAVNIFRDYEHVFGNDEQMLIDSLYAARAIAKKGKVEKRNKKGGINRMPYFFTVWEDAVQRLEQTIALTIQGEG